MKKGFCLEALIVAIGLALMGYFVQHGLEYFTQGQRVVSVKGLAEMEVQADKVIWPLRYVDVGNDLDELYKRIQQKNKILVDFLHSKGITDAEITHAAPVIVDLHADRYMQEKAAYRYNITSVVTVTSSQVDLVRSLMSEQVELLKQGLALAGEDYRYQVDYVYTKLNEIKPQMIEEATKNARRSAEKFAEDSDSNLGKIKHAYQGQFSITDRDPNTRYIKTVRVVNTVDYYLKN